MTNKHGQHSGNRVKILQRQAARNMQKPWRTKGLERGLTSPLTLRYYKYCNQSYIYYLQCFHRIHYQTSPVRRTIKGESGETPTTEGAHTPEAEAEMPEAEDKEGEASETFKREKKTFKETINQI